MANTGPSVSTLRLASVPMVAISIMTSASGFRPVISKSMQIRLFSLDSVTDIGVPLANRTQVPIRLIEFRLSRQSSTPRAHDQTQTHPAPAMAHRKDSRRAYLTHHQTRSTSRRDAERE